MLARPPIAIVGMGCRFPGAANDPESFWQLLTAGRSAIVEVPADRWAIDRFHHPNPAAAGTMVSRRGGFVDQLDAFDAAFWGISPREANRLDPQQRWLLEVAWETLENAGIAPSRLRGRPVGVFLGISGSDYGGLQLRRAEDVDAYTNIGSTSSIASNRISYLLDLRGPSASIDTACSSSLVAMWMACESIWAGNCDAALVGGVNALIAPETSVGFSHAAMLSPSGECFAFDARANGYVRAEGAGMVYLKPLDAARASGDRIYAVVRAVVVNQDGHTTSMTVPSVDQQTAMLRDAYQRAGIDPARVSYVEAHGTGTPVGDPIEATAIGRVIGSGAPARRRPCIIGSVKTNIGHLESGSGMAGLIKAALVLDRRWIPANRNYERANPQIDFDALQLEVASTARPLEAEGDGTAVAGINSFGFGGTNAHVVLEAHRGAPRFGGHPATSAADRPVVLPISARDPTALRNYVVRYRALLAASPERIADIAAASGTRKEHHPQRLAIVGRTAAELRRRSAAWLRDGVSDGVIAGRGSTPSGVVFVLTGQGAQWWGMARQLYAREPIVRTVMDEVDDRFQALGGVPLMRELGRDQAHSRLDRTDIAQPAIFAVQAALLALWQSWGVVPAALVGHSIGEVAAAYGAGALSLEDAVHLVFHRGRLQHRASGLGRMLAVALSPRDAQHAIAPYGDRLEVAAVNSPRLVTLAGDADALEDLATSIRASGVFLRPLRSDYAFHSWQMDPIRDELLASLATLRPRATAVPVVSTVTGGIVDGERLDAAYWWANVREPVLFAPAIAALVERGHDTFLELGPHPALATSIKECLSEVNRPGMVLHSLRREADESEELAANAAALHVWGVPLNWPAINQSDGAVVELPSYPWNRDAYWVESRESATARLLPAAHPLLGVRTEAAQPTWQVLVDVNRLEYLNDHRIADAVIMPAAAYVEIALAVAAELFPRDRQRVEDLDLKRVLIVDAATPRKMQVRCDPDERIVAIYSAARDGAEWTLHASARLTTAPSGRPVTLELSRLMASFGRPDEHDAYVADARARGYQFGRRFQLLQRLWRGGDTALAEIDAPASLIDATSYVFHPAILDACFHAFLGLDAPANDPTALFLPQSIARIQMYRDTCPARLWAHARLGAHDDAALEADIAIHDDEGQPVADVSGFRLERRQESRRPLADDFYRFTWQPRRLRGSRIGGPPVLPPITAVAAEVAAEAAAIASRHDLASYHRDVVPAVERVALMLGCAALQELGWRPAPTSHLQLNSFIDELGIARQYTRVVRRLLRDLADRGVLRFLADDLWEIVAVPAVGDPRAALNALERDFPRSAAEVALLRRTGLGLASVLSGEADPLQLLFPGGARDDMERFYSEALLLPAYHELLAKVIDRAMAAAEERQTLRILEVGGGTAVLTRDLLARLPLDRVEYLFTDVGVAFVDDARKRFGGIDAVECRVFDVETDPAGQQIPVGYFDVIVASQVLHVTANLRHTLTNLGRCLAPGGWLVFLELVDRQFVRDNLTFGLLSGYSRFADVDLRADSPLLDRSLWVDVLNECGFTAAASLSLASDDIAEQAVLVAAAPATPAVTAAGKPYLLIADSQGLAAAVARVLEKSGHRAIVVHRGEVTAAGDVAGILDCASIDRPAADGLDGAQLQAAQSAGVLQALPFIAALANTSVPVWFVTRQSRRVRNEDRVDGLASTPLIGLTRVANNEQGCRFFLIDLDDASTTDAAELLAAHLTLPADGELEQAYREGVRYVPRLEAVPPGEWPARTFPARRGRTTRPYRLEIDHPGVLEHLTLHETAPRPVGAGEVEIDVRAGGLNFRDVMKALGSHPGHPVDLRWLGDDVSGVVRRVGAGVTEWRPGDEVAGVAPYAFQSLATTDARLLFRKPASWSFAEAATVPTAFLTAHFALVHLARLQPGERVLIHAGAGGVGQAAIQIARRLQLEIFATAGSPEKRHRLLDAGAQHVMDSRTLDFADEIMKSTGGRGVDAVLNSLAGEFIAKSLSVLAPFGRFLEIGKVDIYRRSRLELHALRQNIALFVIDLAQHLTLKHPVVVELLADLARSFDAGAYRPLPLTTFPVERAADAFRHMAQARHVGKVVLTFDRPDVPIACSSDGTRRFRDDVTYLITGGAGGVGLEVARWIASHGGRHLALVSRSGPRDAAAAAQIEALRGAGSLVRDIRADVADAGDVARALAEIDAHLPPLGGVFHAAMVLDDALIGELDDERMWRAMAPKVLGGWNLHAATRGRDTVEHFVCFSSFSTVVAAPRQANYNAGNVFLEALAEYRRAQGLPAQTISWGAIDDAGYVWRNPKTAATLAALGLSAFRIDDALQALNDIVAADLPHLVAARVAWPQVLKLSPLVATANTYASVARQSSGAERTGPLDARLRSTPPDEWPRLVEDCIAGHVAAIFATPPARIDRATPLNNLGLDSLMTLELVNRLDRDIGLRIPIASVSAGASIVELAAVVLRSMAPAPAGAASPSPAESATPSAPAGRGLSDPARHLVTLRAATASSEPPLFGFHPVGGGVSVYAPLVAHLATAIPVYGVESGLLMGAPQEYADVDAMVMAYAEAVRRTHPGPYRLFGFSLGGYVAARVGEVFEQEGRPVELVGIIDFDARQGAAPETQRQSLTRLAVAAYLFLQQELGLLRARSAESLQEEIAQLVDRVFDEQSGGEVFFSWAVQRGLMMSPDLEGFARSYLARLEQHCRLLTRPMRLPRLRAPLYVWRASHGFGSPLASWDHRGDVGREFVIDGDHNALIRPAALELIASTLNDVLEPHHATGKAP